MKLATSLLAASSLASTASAQSMSFSMGQTEMVWDGGQWVPAETWGGGKSGKGGKPTSAKSAKSTISSKSSKSTSKEWWSAAPTVSNAPSTSSAPSGEWSEAWKDTGKSGKSGSKSSKTTSDDKWASGKSGKWSSKDWWSPPTPPPTPEPVCGDGTNPVVRITGAERAAWAGGNGAIFGGNTYNFTDTLGNLDCQGRVDFVREEFLFHPFRLCVGGIVGNATDPTDGSKCESRFQQGCGIDCFGNQVGIDLAPSSDSDPDPESCTSIDISGRELWYVCTVDRHDMYNRLC